MEEMHQQKVEQMIKSAEGSAGHLHTIPKPKLWRRRRRSTDLGTVVRQQGKNGQYIGNVMRRYRTNTKDKTLEE